MICSVLAMEMLQGVWKQHLRPRAVVGYGVKIFLPSPPNYVTRSHGRLQYEDDYEYEYEFSVLSTRFRFDGRKFSKCACSEL